MFDIMKGVPMPSFVQEKGKGSSSPVPATVKQLRVGECFFVPVCGLKERNAISASAHVTANNNGMKIATRTISGTPKDKMGIWRIK